jgi:hypothetical protein
VGSRQNNKPLAAFRASRALGDLISQHLFLGFMAFLFTEVNKG